MKLGWVIIGILIAIGLFIFVPGLFNALVSLVQKGIHFISSFIQSQNITNKT